MTPKPQRRDQARELFDGALERAPGERSAFLDAACVGDAGLRLEVDSLLALHAEAEGALRDPMAQVSEQPGDRIGHYKLLEKIGEGGFGTVWMAEQQEPVRRMVALKVLKAGMDTAQVVARFEAERQALALMDHPNIAHVFDGGATPQGRPYFAMELVRGVPITKYCDDAVLSPRERLELFIPVCQAVQHAHFKGVVHRDIKPNNVLVTLHDGVPVPKVIDFGIAKAIQGRLTERTLFTGFQQMLGTPEYMAPEQAERSGLDVDTRADVYSLGVLLYELLTGTRPFDLHTLLQAGYAEMLRTIKEVEPPKPSTRVSTLGERLPGIARHRGTQPRALGALMRGELDWIVMKTLEKERNRRYSTASALAEDIQRHLRNEPVEAGPPSSIYKMRKYVQRHRIGVLTLTATACAIAAFLFTVQSKNSELLAKNAALDEATRSARESEAEARRERQNVLNLSAFQTLQDLTQEARDLWPAEPALVDRYRDWMRRAERLLAMLPEFRATLAGIESRDAAQDHAPDATESSERWWRAQLSKLITELEDFADPRTGLAYGLSRTDGWGIARRLEFAASVEERTLRSPEATRLWSEALAAISRSVRYREARWPAGVGFAPQLGLLPLGADSGSGLWEFAHLESGAPAVRGTDGTLILTEDTGIVLVLIPGGTFWMGAQSTDPAGQNYDPHADDSESPVHAVALSPYFLSKFEMTQGQWDRFTGHNPSNFGPSSMLPVEQVTWTQSMGVMTRMGLELPTEAQWENACRAGTRTPWWTGSDAESVWDRTSPAGATELRLAASRKVFDDRAEVEGHWVASANPYGLYEVHGGVWEWCRDAFGPYSEATGFDPDARGDHASRRMIRGGSLEDSALFEAAALSARSAFRNTGKPEFLAYDVGLRPARSVQPAVLMTDQRPR